MKYLLCFPLILLTVSLSTCGNAPSNSGNHSFTITLRYSVPDALEAVMYTDHSIFLQTTTYYLQKLAAEPQGDALTLFLDSFEELFPDRDIESLIDLKKAKDFTPGCSPAELQNYLRRQVMQTGSSVIEALRERVSGQTRSNPEILSHTAGSIRVKVKGIHDPQLLEKALSAQAQLIMCEVYPWQEMDQTLREALQDYDPSATSDEAQTRYSFFQKTGTNDAVFVPEKYFESVKVMLQSDRFRSHFPKDLRFAWGTGTHNTLSPDEAGRYLYALHLSPQREQITNADIETVLVFDQSGATDVITLEMNEKGREKLAQMTLKNVNRALAIVVNGQVWSAPYVLSPITEGSLQISGTGYDTDVTLFKAGFGKTAYPVKVEIAEVK